MAYIQLTNYVPQWHASDNTLASGQVIKAYLAGTTTATNIFSDSSGTVAGTSVALNARGEPEVSGNTIIPYLSDSIIYKLALYPTQAAADADSGAIWTQDDINPASTTSSFKLIGQYSDSLATAISDIGATKTTLWIDKSITVPANATVPDNISLKFLHGGELSVNSGVTVTIKKSTPDMAGNYQIFSGSGTVKLRGYCNVKWFGCIGDWNGSTGTDNTDAFNKCTAALWDDYGTIYAPWDGAKYWFDPAHATGVSVPEYADMEDVRDTPATRQIMFDKPIAFIEERPHSFIGNLPIKSPGNPESANAYNFCPMSVSWGMTAHGTVTNILRVGAIETTADARCSFSADVSIDIIPGMWGQALLNPAGSTTDITNREAPKGGGAQFIANRASGGNLIGLSLRRDLHYDNDTWQFRTDPAHADGDGRRFTGNVVTWDIRNGTAGNSATDDFVISTGIQAPRNAAYRIEQGAIAAYSTNPADSNYWDVDYTEAAKVENLKHTWKGRVHFDMTGETGTINTPGAGLTTYNGGNILFEFNWNAGGQRFDGVRLEYDETGAFANDTSPFYVKEKTGKQLLRLDTTYRRTRVLGLATDEQSLGDGASLTPDASQEAWITVGALTQNTTINNPTNPVKGAIIEIHIRQDGVGGRTVTWGAGYKHAWSNAGNAANLTSTITFRYNGTAWDQVGAQGPYI